MRKNKKRLSRRGRRSLGVVLDANFCRKFGLDVGDEVEIWEHPRKPGLIQIQVPANRVDLERMRSRLFEAKVF